MESISLPRKAGQWKVYHLLLLHYYSTPRGWCNQVAIVGASWCAQSITCHHPVNGGVDVDSKWKPPWTTLPELACCPELLKCVCKKAAIRDASVWRQKLNAQPYSNVMALVSNQSRLRTWTKQASAVHCHPTSLMTDDFFKMVLYCQNLPYYWQQRLIASQFSITQSFTRHTLISEHSTIIFNYSVALHVFLKFYFLSIYHTADLWWSLFGVY